MQLNRSTSILHEIFLLTAWACACVDWIWGSSLDPQLHDVIIDIWVLTQRRDTWIFYRISHSIIIIYIISQQMKLWVCWVSLGISSFRCTNGDFYLALGSSMGLAPLVWVGGLLKRVLYFFGNELSLGQKSPILHLPPLLWCSWKILNLLHMLLNVGHC